MILFIHDVTVDVFEFHGIMVINRYTRAITIHFVYQFSLSTLKLSNNTRLPGIFEHFKVY